MKYKYHGEDEETLQKILSNLSNDTKNYNKNDFISPSIGLIIVDKKYKDTWIYNLLLFFGWKVVKK